MMKKIVALTEGDYGSEWVGYVCTGGSRLIQSKKTQQKVGMISN